MSTERAAPIEADGPAAVTPQAFLGWRIVGTAFLAQLLGTGVTLSAFSNFVLPLSESFSVSRGTITLGTTIAIACIGTLGPFVGRWVDRGHARWIMTSGAMCSGVGLLLLARIHDLRLFAVVFGGLVCVGAALFGMMPSMTLVANWFVKRRGFALGLTFAGSTIASAVAPVTAQYLIDTSGWRTALLYFGIAVLGIGVPTFATFIVGRPEEVGQWPDGDAWDGDPTAMSGGLGEILEVPELARDPRLWLISLGFGLVMTSPIVLITLLVPFGQSLGFSAQQSNLFLVAMVPFSLFGKLGLGALADRAAAKPIIAVIVSMNVLVWLIFYSEPSFLVFIIAGAVYGLGIGGAAPVQGVVIGRCFGRVNFGTASGLGGILSIALLIAATLMSSALQGEHGEGYPTIFLTQACLLLIGGAVLALVRIPAAHESVESTTG